MKILLVEDDANDMLFAQRAFAELGHDVVCAADGVAALELYRREKPDLVVTDVHLPGTDGFELTRAVQREAAPRWQPVMFLSGDNGEAMQVKALSVGADAYVAKPISPTLLDARLQVLARLLATQRQAEERAHELERYYANEEQDKRIAQHLLKRLVNTELLDDPAIGYWISPAALFSGDILAAARTPGGALHVLQADGTGHGLAASINVLPIISPFYRMTEKGFGIEAIVRELNAKVKQLLPADRFVAASIASIDFREGLVRLWNGANPAPLMIDAGGGVDHLFSATHPPLGVLGDSDFEADAEAHAFSPGSQLFLYSDGLIEATNGAGELFGDDRLRDTLAQLPADDRIDGVVRAVSAHLGGAIAHDDISLLLVRCDSDSAAAEPVAHTQPRLAADAGTWRFALRLAASELKKLDVVPVLLGLANQFEGGRTRSGELFVILAELFNNALDHGLLRLDSTIKLGADGMERWIAERSERLSRLEEGEVELVIEQFLLDRRPCLRIVCRDSGPGFDHAAAACRAACEGDLPFGRGIALVRRMAASVEYNDAGNEVRVLLSPSQGDSAIL